MELWVSLVVLGAALLHAAWNALVKTGTDRTVTLALVSTFWLVMGSIVAVFVPVPAPEAWPYLLASTALHYGYLVSLLLMYRLGDLGHVYPIARGSGPLLLAGASAWLLGHSPTPVQWLGVATVSLGVVSLALQGGGPPRDAWRPVAAALVNGVFIAAYSLTDGIGVRLSGSSVGYATWLLLLQGVPWIVVLAWVRLRMPARVPQGALLPGALAGAMAGLAYGLVLWAFTQAPVTLVAALRETSVIFAALIGTLTLGEPFGRWRIAAAVLVVAGVALLHA